jgi:very-short-patch-repair endonuclease
MTNPDPNNPAKTKRATQLARMWRRQDTWAELLMWRWLRARRLSAYKSRRQHPYGPYILDFFCLEAGVAIEIGGSQHAKPEQQARDGERDIYSGKCGIKVLRFWNSRLRREKAVVRDTIWRTLQARAPHPLPNYCGPMPVNLAR